MHALSTKRPRKTNIFVKTLPHVELTQQVLGRLTGTTDSRYREIMTTLISHLHAFIRETNLTENEWQQGIEFLTATGRQCDDKRQEFILLSDILGVSMLVDALSHPRGEGTTESTVLGPFFRDGAPRWPHGADIASGVPGIPLVFSGRVIDDLGRPIGDAAVEVWGADGEGWYDVQLADSARMRARGGFTTDAKGEFWFRSVKPVSYPVPSDGPVGKILRKMGRHPFRPAHIHFNVSATGYRPLVTHVFVRGDRYLDSDAVFGVKDSLITDFIHHDSGIAPDGTPIPTAYTSAQFDFVLDGA